MKVFIVFASAKYLSNQTVEEVRSTLSIVPIITMFILPMILVLLQPDLGTAMILLLIGFAMLFVAGVQIWKFITVLGIAIATAPILWNLLYDYQKDRISMFFSPEKDPNGAGYHIIQSQIALGSGGLNGKGLLNGTQCQLNFLPEKQTDFVFAALGEELGFVGCIVLIVLYVALISYNICVALRQKSKFLQLLIFGMNAMLFFYVFINISMVCGLLPVVGVPLPFFSYGGSSLVVLMFCQGIIFSADIEQRKSLGFNPIHQTHLACLLKKV
jgi:rod shape determining protein RodA